jgi:type I restriction enzyme S subunit
MTATSRKISVSELLTSGEVELKTGPFGTQLKASDYVDGGVPVINVRNIGFGRIRKDKLEFISDETRDRLSTHVLRPNDIVFGRKGAVERHVFIRKEQDGWFQGSDCLRFRLKSPRIHAEFASYYFLTQEHQSWMKNQCSHGATMASLNQGILERIELPLPNLPTQKKIAGILSAYDDLIENNLRRIRILEEMAQSLYREWFVHFRFPGHEQFKFVDSPLGKIPEGWVVKKLGEVADVNAQSIRKNNAPSSINYIDIKSVSTASIDAVKPVAFADAPSRARRIVRHGDVIWSTVRPNRRSFALILDPIENLIASTGFAVLSAKAIPASYLYYATTTEDFTGYLVNHATGAAYPAVNAGIFEEAPIVVPPVSLLDQFNASAESMLRLSHVLQRRNANLRITRDLLLPKLLSGK